MSQEDGGFLSDDQQADEGQGEASPEYRAAREALENDVHTLFTSPAGERFLEHMYQYCRQGRSTFIPGDPHATSFYEGKREVMLYIMSLLHVDDQEIIEQSRNRALEGKQTK